MQNIILVAIGGMLGCVTRYGVLSAFSENIRTKLPEYINYVLVVNVIGSFLIGLIFAGYERGFFNSNTFNIVKPLLAIGFLGGLTTFSSFTLDFLQFIQKGQVINGLIYVVLSVFLGIVAVYAGYLIAK
ncbi:MAG: CrcB family protein [Rickettsiales bacterium]|nr:CrcB family protein [Rickettsiales bacterium]